eukprot:8689880-Pyramimonas_sp.AAC.1
MALQCCTADASLYLYFDSTATDKYPEYRVADKIRRRHKHQDNLRVAPPLTFHLICAFYLPTPGCRVDWRLLPLLPCSICGQRVPRWSR